MTTPDILGGLQVRQFELELGCLRAADGDDGYDLEGIAAPYNEIIPVSSEYTEELMPRVFRRSYLNAAQRKVRTGPDGVEIHPGIPLMMEHENSVSAVVGRSVGFVETERGLVGRWKFANTDTGREAREMLLDGAVSSLSVGFTPNADGNVIEMRGEGEPIHVKRVRASLREVSVVAVGAYPSAQVTVVRAGVIRPPRPHAEQLRRWLEQNRTV
jgi:HK97 family phage prohead protease